LLIPVVPNLNNLPNWENTFENGVLVVTNKPKIRKITRIGVASTSVTNAVNEVETP
jgi:hypothetical protein